MRFVGGRESTAYSLPNLKLISSKEELDNLLNTPSVLTLSVRYRIYWRPCKTTIVARCYRCSCRLIDSQTEKGFELKAISNIHHHSLKIKKNLKVESIIECIRSIPSELDAQSKRAMIKLRMNVTPNQIRYAELKLEISSIKYSNL